MIGRGFGLMHDRGSDGGRRHREAPVDAGQPGVRLVRAVLGGARARRGADARSRRPACGVSVAEVVSPTESASAPLARELMVALVRAGVTATCSSADKPRYGDLDRRLQPARRPDRARRPGPERLHRSGARGRRPRLHRGAEAAALHQRARRGCGCRPSAVGRANGCPARTCAACARCRCCRRGRRPRRRGGRRRRGPRRRRDRCRPGRAVGARALRGTDRRGAQPRHARLRRRVRRHAAHVADAVVHRLAVRHLDRPAAAHRARRLELPAAALDPHLRLRARLRRRRLAAGGHPRPQRGVLAPAAGRRRKQQGRRRVAGVGIAAGDRARGQRGTRRAQGGGQPAGRAAAASTSIPPTVSRSGWSKHRGATTDVVVRSGLRRVSAASRVDLLEQPRCRISPQTRSRCTATRSPRC